MSLKAELNRLLDRSAELRKRAELLVEDDARLTHNNDLVLAISNLATTLNQTANRIDRAGLTMTKMDLDELEDVINRLS